ncbi:hypothetical protein L4D20_05810 [Vibrio kyushuensis]|uniref:hypothetical protein n=1 Tax=Vibrio kyushuensis TaxID=2910249 RepID=UPI003D13758E
MTNFPAQKCIENIRAYLRNQHPDKVKEFEGFIEKYQLKELYFWLGEHISSIDDSEEFHKLMKDYFFSIH